MSLHCFCSLSNENNFGTTEYNSSLSHRFSFHSCTQDLPVAVTLTMTHYLNATRAIVPCPRAQTGVSASSLILLWSRLRGGVEVSGRLLAASHPHKFPDSLRGVIVRNTYHCLHVENNFDVTSGGGTVRLWWTAVVHMDCGVDEQLVSKDTRQKRKLLKRCSGPRGVLPTTKQHFNLNDNKSSYESC